jgi:hypothetical protein
LINSCLLWFGMALRQWKRFSWFIKHDRLFWFFTTFFLNGCPCKSTDGEWIPIVYLVLIMICRWHKDLPALLLLRCYQVIASWVNIVHMHSRFTGVSSLSCSGHCIIFFNLNSRFWIFHVERSAPSDQLMITVPLWGQNRFGSFRKQIRCSTRCNRNSEVILDIVNYDMNFFAVLSTFSK